jgi:hypothetical protein
MRRQSAELRARKQRALELLAAGKSAPKVAAEVGLHVDTVRRLRAEEKLAGETRGRPADPPGPQAPPTRGTVLQMLRAEAPDVYRVLLDAAKGGDIRAAGLIVKMLGNSLTEGFDDGDDDAGLDELERGLQSLPSDIAAEMAGLLAEAHTRSARPPARSDQEPGGPGLPAGRLPWQAEDHPSDEGSDSV